MSGACEQQELRKAKMMTRLDPACEDHSTAEVPAAEVRHGTATGASRTELELIGPWYRVERERATKQTRSCFRARRLAR